MCWPRRNKLTVNHRCEDGHPSKIWIGHGFVQYESSNTARRDSEEADGEESTEDAETSKELKELDFKYVPSLQAVCAAEHLNTLLCLQWWELHATLALLSVLGHSIGAPKKNGSRMRPVKRA